MEKEKKMTSHKGITIKELSETGWRRRKNRMEKREYARMKCFWVRSKSWIREIRRQANLETIEPCVHSVLIAQTIVKCNNESWGKCGWFLSWVLHGSLWLLAVLFESNALWKIRMAIVHFDFHMRFWQLHVRD